MFPSSVADATLRGLRGPPNEVAVLGASNYLNETLRPGGTHHKKHCFVVENQPPVVSRGVISGERAGAVRVEPSAATATLTDALQFGQQIQHADAPVHIHDLTQVANETTRLLVEKETEVLRYIIFTVDEMPDNAIEPLRPRLFNMHYYTSNCTMAVFERLGENSGMVYPQFAKRHAAMVPGMQRPYVPGDMHIGALVSIYGKDFIIADADDHTRKVLAEKYGIHLGEKLPETATELGRREFVGHVPKRNTVAFDVGKEEDPTFGFYKKSGDSRKYFLERGAAMLKFECEWQEPGEAFSDRRKLALQYYLADDTLEILDKSSAYSSGGLFNKVFQRQRLARMNIDADKEAYFPPEYFESVGVPKTKLVLPPGDAVLRASESIRRLYEYSTGNSTRGKFTSPITGRPLYAAEDSSETGHFIKGAPVLTSFGQAPAFVTAADLVCGGVVSVYGRPLLIRSCDPFTVAYYIHNFGVDMRAMFVKDAPEADPDVDKKVPLPAHVGALAIGSEEETRKNAGKLLPTYRRHKDFERYYQLGGKALKFRATFDDAEADPEDTRRKFIVSYYLEDDTLMISELTGNTLGHGPSVTRFLNRGRYRNFDAPVDADAVKAIGIQHTVTEMPAAVAAAYDRVFGASRDKMGYTENSGAQGYGGGIFGKAERVGPGGTGVESVADIGVRSGNSRLAGALPRYFCSEDFFEGARIRLDHAPDLCFVLHEGDRFTQQFLEARAITPSDDAKDVYVPENHAPVPSLPLEAFQESEEATAGNIHFLTVAKILSGVLESARAVIRQKDKASRGYAPRSVVQSVLASYGVQPPACAAETVQYVLDAVSNSRKVAVSGGSPEPKSTQRLARSLTQTMRRPATAPTAIGSIDDPLAGPFLRDFASVDFSSVEMIDYDDLFRRIRSATHQQLALQPRMDKLMSQLRAALLSSRTHLRKVFRDLDVAGTGAITMSEFRHLLARHTLDIGISDAQLRALLQRFPAASEGAEYKLGEPAIDWNGFVEALLDAKTLSTDEVRNFMSFVKGLKDKAEHGVGGMRTVPQTKPQMNRASAWNEFTADPSEYLRAMGHDDITVSRPSTAPSTISSKRATPPKPPAPVTDFGSVPVGGSPGLLIAKRPSAAHGTGAQPPKVPALPEAKATFPCAATLSNTGDAMLVDAIEALKGDAAGIGLLARIEKSFDRKRFDLYRALSLYDTMRKKVLNVQSFVAALCSAGLKLDRSETSQLTKALLDHALRSGATSANEHDVQIDYGRFFDDIFAAVAV